MALSCLLGLSAMTGARLATAADTPVVAKHGALVFSADGARLSEVYRVTDDGSVQIIFDGKMVTIPGSSLSTRDGKLTTSLKKSEITNLKR
jgi:hypothetical protein